MVNDGSKLQKHQACAMDLEEIRKKISQLLYSLGITGRYVGYAYLCDALERLIVDGDDVSLLTKRLLPEVARKYKTNWQTVERGIRAVIDVTWELRPDCLDTVFDRKLNHRPPLKEFLFGLREYLIINSQEDSLH